jgi:hypothetical protein
MIGDQRHLAHQVRGDEDGAALGGQAGEQVADPEHALRVQAVDHQVVERRPPGVDRPGLKQRADLVQRGGVPGVAAAVHGRASIIAPPRFPAPLSVAPWGKR